jgi:hypothetical protein
VALQRLSRKAASARAALDLFDAVSAMLESSNQGRTWFVKEARILARHPDIGRSYDALRFASALAAVVGRNPVHEDSRGSVARLLATALAAFGASDRPDIVYLKSLYLFARDEGYPVRQEWLPSLAGAQGAAAAAILGRRLGDQDACAADVERLRGSLEAYLGAHTEIIIP